MAQRAKTHAAPRGVAHLAILQVKARTGKEIEIAGVVVMQMGDDDVLDRVCLDAKARQRVDRIEREFAAASLRLGGVETGVYQNIAATAADQPDEVIEVLGGGLVRVRHKVIQGGRGGDIVA